MFGFIFGTLKAVNSRELTLTTIVFSLRNNYGVNKVNIIHIGLCQRRALKGSRSLC